MADEVVQTVEQVPAEIEKSQVAEEGAGHPQKRLTSQQEDLISFYEGRSQGDSLAPALWSKIREAQIKGHSTPEIEIAYRNRDSADQQEFLRDMVGETQSPITPDYFPNIEADDVEARVQQRLAEIEMAKVFEAHERRVTETRSSHPDYEEALADYGHLPIALPIQEAIVRLENGPEVMYEAAKSGVIEDLLTRMTPVQAVAELGRISARLEGRRPAVTTAFAPPKPVQRTQASKTVDVHDPDLPFDQYVRARDKQEAAKRGR